jgi:hypothetical protein
VRSRDVRLSPPRRPAGRGGRPGRGHFTSYGNAPADTRPTHSHRAAGRPTAIPAVFKFAAQSGPRYAHNKIFLKIRIDGNLNPYRRPRGVRAVFWFVARPAERASVHHRSLGIPSFASSSHFEMAVGLWSVMTGLVPVIHAAPLRQTSQGHAGGLAWMAGTSPAMTVRVKMRTIDRLRLRKTTPRIDFLAASRCADARNMQVGWTSSDKPLKFLISRMHGLFPRGRYQALSIAIEDPFERSRYSADGLRMQDAAA